MDVQPLISKACKEDLNAILEIENENFGDDSFNRSQFARALKNERAIFIKAEIPGLNGAKKKLAGYALGFCKKVGKPGSQYFSAYLYSIAVAKAAQGMSIGKKLLLEFHRLVKSRDCAIIYLEVRTDNAAAIKLYESFGYIRKGVIQNFYHDLSPAFKYFKNDL